MSYTFPLSPSYYQVRCTLRTSPKLPVRVDVSLPPRKSGREPRSPRERE